MGDASIMEGVRTEREDAEQRLAIKKLLVQRSARACSQHSVPAGTNSRCTKLARPIWMYQW